MKRWNLTEKEKRHLKLFSAFVFGIYVLMMAVEFGAI